MSSRTIFHGLAALTSSVILLVVGLPTPATAEPETPVVYPSGSTATQADGLGFDTCTAPSLAALRAWRGTSPYTVVNIYFGGNNRGCTQPNLTKAWVRDATAMVVARQRRRTAGAYVFMHPHRGGCRHPRGIVGRRALRGTPTPATPGRG